MPNLLYRYLAAAGTPNASIRYPGGRVLSSDVRDAATRMAADTPRQSSATQPTNSNPNEIYDSAMGAWKNIPSVTVYGNGPDYAGFKGDNFFYGDRNGGPTVETPTAASSPFDEWWKTTVAPTPPPAASGLPGGTAYLDSPLMSPEPFDVPGIPQTEPTADVSWPDPGSFDVPPVSQTEPNVNVDIPNPDAFDVPPLSQQTPSADVSWSDPAAFDVPSTGTASEPGGITNYGSGRQGSDLRTFGNNLTLGEFLNTPLAQMNFGQGYPAVSGGNVTYGGVTDHTAGTPTGAVQTDPLTGQPFNLNDIPSGIDETVRTNAASTGGIEWTQGQTYDDSPEVRPAEPITESERWTFDTGQPAAAPPQHGVVTARDPGFNQGYGQSASSEANAMIMNSQAYGGNPNVTRVNDEERIMHGSIGSERGPIQTYGRPRARQTESSFIRDLVAARGSRSRRPAPPATGGGQGG